MMIRELKAKVERIQRPTAPKKKANENPMMMRLYQDNS
jgi:hypothetical protein